MGHVAKLVTGDELIINRGSVAGVATGDEFEVLDQRAMNVKDPKTGEDLGSIARRKATVRVYRVTAKLALAKDTQRQTLSVVSAVISGTTTEEALAGDRWHNGVEVGDPVRRTRLAPTDGSS